MNALLMAMGLLVVGALLSLLIGRRSALCSLCAVLSNLLASVLVVPLAVRVLAGNLKLDFSWGWAVPGGSLNLQLDALAACFLLPIALLNVCCALYGAGYLREEGHHRSLAPHWFFYNLMVAAMLLVVLAANALLFLAAWEVMTLASFFLVAWDHQDEEVRRAAGLYLMVAHGGLTLLLLFFAQVGALSGSFDFAAFGPLRQLPPLPAALLFGLLLGGFGVKAGLLPLHIWLPGAHPAAPSHVSAMMSGVLVKTGLYGLLRFLLLLPPAPAWWGYLLALLGIAGALYGITQAALQSDIKRCLAYSTVENLGILFLGLGLTLAAQAQGRELLALLAGSGTLLHLWNHVLFKGLMFLGAGALLQASGSRDINRLGGLLRRLPLVGLCWIGGALALSAVPPFNGLTGEALLYLTLLQAASTLPAAMALPAVLLVGLLALVGAIALVTFVRLIGLSLLGAPRSAAAAQARQVSPLLWLPLLLLCGACLVAGLWPAPLLRLQAPVVALLAPLAAVDSLPASGLQLPQQLGCFGGAVLLLVLAVVGLLLGLRRRRPLRWQPTWGCGYVAPAARQSYSAAGFSELLFRRLLPRFLQPRVQLQAPAELLAGAARLNQQAPDPLLESSWLPLMRRLAQDCQRLRWLQQGQLAIYLLYIFVTSALLLVWTLWAGRGG